jgi:hypothetical protein
MAGGDRMTRSSRHRSGLIGLLAGPALAVAAFIVTALLTAGCTTTVGGTPVANTSPVPSEGPGSDPVAWADRVCEAVLSFTGPATSPPDFSRTSDLPAVQRAVSSYLGTVVTGAQQGQARLAEVGAAPEPGGDVAVRRAQDALGALEEDFGGVKTTVDEMDPNDPGAVMATRPWHRWSRRCRRSPRRTRSATSPPRHGCTGRRSARRSVSGCPR